MTADALNSLQRRIGNDISEVKRDIAEVKQDIAEVKHDFAEVKHDIHLLNVKIDVNRQATDEKLDRGFRQVLEYLDKR